MDELSNKDLRFLHYASIEPVPESGVDRVGKGTVDGLIERKLIRVTGMRYDDRLCQVTELGSEILKLHDSRLRSILRRS